MGGAPTVRAGVETAWAASFPAETAAHAAHYLPSQPNRPVVLADRSCVHPPRMPCGMPRAPSLGAPSRRACPRTHHRSAKIYARNRPECQAPERNSCMVPVADWQEQRYTDAVDGRDGKRPRMGGACEHLRTLRSGCRGCARPLPQLRLADASGWVRQSRQLSLPWRNAGRRGAGSSDGAYRRSPSVGCGQWCLSSVAHVRRGLAAGLGDSRAEQPLLWDVWRATGTWPGILRPVWHACRGQRRLWRHGPSIGCAAAPDRR